MPTVLICGPDRLMDDLRGTMLARVGIDCIHVHGFQQALGMAVAARPDLVVVDRDLPQAGRLVEDLRGERSTRRASIVVAARGDLEPAELNLMKAGANALLRLPGGPDADLRLAQLMEVPPRRTVRLPVRLQFDAFRVQRDDLVHGLVLDLSVHGMLVQCAPLEVGTELEFAIELTEAGELACGRCRVIRSDGLTSGLAFEAMGPEDAERIARHAEA